MFNGKAITVTEPSDSVFDQSVDFYLPSPAGFLDHFIIYSDTTPEPSFRPLIGLGLIILIGIGIIRERRRGGMTTLGR
jgi:hypothetical protein